MEEFICKTECEVGYYPDSSDVCHKCNDQCLKCENSKNNCTECKENFILVNNECHPDCSEGYYYNSSDYPL